jgi:uncharacterized secreted protein with C-terminal beta-propeller domain
MRSIISRFGSVIGFGLLVNCGHIAAPSTYEEGSGGATAAAGPAAAEGDIIDGGEVVDATYGNGCTIVQIVHPPAWACSDAQLADAKVYPGSSGSSAAAPPATTPPAAVLADDVALRPMDCQGLADLRRPALKDAHHQTLAVQRYNLLAKNCVGRTETRYLNAQGQQVSSCSTRPSGTGGSTSGGYPYGPSYSTGGSYASMAPSEPAPSEPVPSTPSDDPGAEDYSETNVQVAGVDEPDFLKNDSGHVYVLAGDGVRVIDAWPAAETHEIARVSVLGEPRRMFLAGGRLAVYSRLANLALAGISTSGSNSVPSSQGCTYGYSCRFTSEGGATLVTIFDVSTPDAPSELGRYALSGGFVAARRIGDDVYTVVHDQGLGATPNVTVALEASDAQALEIEYERLLREADVAVDALPVEDFLPWVRNFNRDTNEWAGTHACDEALATRSAAGQSFVSVVAFDLATLSGLTRTITAGKPGFVYSSAEGLYLATDGVEGGDFAAQSIRAAVDDFSTIHKFSLAEGSARYVGSHPVRGHVLNQFSMDERDGVLRVATSSGAVPDPNAVSNVTTLGEGEDGLVRFGELTGLAPSEDIRSVRFDGDRGFIVTFKKTDPLFVIDLANPAQPNVLGELKIPGFSTYMHRLDDNHLLAVGFDADDQGSFAYFDGIQIQIFDVTDLQNPALLHKTVIGTRGSGSEALMNHLAFNYFATRGLLALPMTICEGGDNGVYADELTFSGLMVFDVSLEGGIVERGRLPFLDVSEASASAAGTSCSSWWSSSRSLVKRSIFMEDFAYGLSDATLKVAAVDQLSDVLRSVDLR